MEELVHALKQTQARSHAPANAILDMVDEWKDMGENLFKSVVDCVSDIESRDQNLRLLGESLEKRFKQLEERKREFESFQEEKKRELALKETGLSPLWEDFAKEIRLREEKLDEQLKLVHEHIESLEVTQREVEGLRVLECEKLKEIEKREREIDHMGWSMEKQLREVKQREKEFDSFQDGKLRELASKEELLSRKKEEFVKEVKLASEKFREGENLGSGLIGRLELALNMLEGMKVTVDERFKEIESWKTVTEKSLTGILIEADLIRESLDERLTEFEEMEKEFNSFQQDKMHELESKERQISIMRIELLKEVNSRDEKLTEKFKEIESWETMAHKSLTASLIEADLIRESLEKRFKEFEEMEKEFNSFQEDKMQTLESKERQLSIMRIELLKEVKLRDEKLTEQQKLGHHLLNCLEEMVAKKLKGTESQELTLNGTYETLDASAEDADLTRESANIPFQELEKSENGIKSEEDVEISKENELKGKKKELELKEGILGSPRKEHEFKEQHLEEVDQGEKNLNSVREFAQTCLKENITFNKLHEEDAGYLAEKDHQPERRPRELELKQKQSGGLFQDIDAHLIVEPDKSLDLRHAVQDGKTLELFINNTEKDSELIGDEVFKVLLRSSDPAKLVLDTMEGFYTPHLRRGDMKKGILLLDQLTKMSPNIQPCVREAALKLATEWKSKMRTSAENPFEVLGFLHLLAAYNLSSCFDKDEVFGFLKMVAQHKQTPELCRILGLTENLPGLIQSLLNEKQFLLASTYIYECELENMFPQAAVLNYYVQHAKFSAAKAKCNREHNSSEAQDKAIASEIADLRVAIEHIIKYGLESECSPDTLTARIKQLERDRAILRNGKPSSSNHEKSERSIQRQNAKERKAQQKKGSEEGSSDGWKALHPKSKRKEGPVNFHEPWPRNEQGIKSLPLSKIVDEVPMTLPSRAQKRRRTNIFSHEGQSINSRFPEITD